VNSGDAEQIRAFAKANFTPRFLEQLPLEEHVAFLLGYRDQTGGVDFYAIRSYPAGGPPDSGTIVLVRARLTGAWQGLRFEIEPKAPYRIQGVQISPARPPKDLPALPLMTPEEAVAELKSFLAKLSEADAFSGAVLLARDGKPVFQSAYGEAEKSFHAPNKLDTRFNLGSMNKMFTAVAVAQLVQAGKMSFEDPISTWLDRNWLPRVDMTKVKVKHLLSHTSGLGNYFNETFERTSRLQFRAVRDYKPLVREETLAFNPGERFEYSNTGFLLLGAIVEKVSGKDYFDYVRDRIYGPAGMTGSDSYEVDYVNENLAVGYTKEPGTGKPRWRTNLFVHVVKGGPAGGGYSTVGDLLRFGEALRSGKLVDSKMVQTLTRPKPELHSPEYGYGFMILTGPAGRIAGHGGGFAGISSNLDLFLDAGYTGVVLSNYDMAAFPVFEKIRELVGRIKR
jgi:CubicO group peptidase (beta-lactamase class C family)